MTAGKVDAEWTVSFGKPVEAAIAAAIDRPETPSSPLIATTAALLTRPDFDTSVAARRLVMVSDMVEHQKGGYSHLAGGDFWKGYANSGLARYAALDLRGVAVAIDYLPRPQYATVQGLAHRRFWQRLFAEVGAAEVTFIGLAAPDASPPGTSASPEPMAAKKRQRGL